MILEHPEADVSHPIFIISCFISAFYGLGIFFFELAIIDFKLDRARAIECIKES